MKTKILFLLALLFIPLTSFGQNPIESHLKFSSQYQRISVKPMEGGGLIVLNNSFDKSLTYLEIYDREAKLIVMDSIPAKYPDILATAFNGERYLVIFMDKANLGGAIIKKSLYFYCYDRLGTLVNYRRIENVKQGIYENLFYAILPTGNAGFIIIEDSRSDGKQAVSVEKVDNSLKMEWTHQFPAERKTHWVDYINGTFRYDRIALTLRFGKNNRFTDHLIIIDGRNGEKLLTKTLAEGKKFGPFPTQPIIEPDGSVWLCRKSATGILIKKYQPGGKIGEGKKIAWNEEIKPRVQTHLKSEKREGFGSKKPQLFIHGMVEQVDEFYVLGELFKTRQRFIPSLFNTLTRDDDPLTDDGPFTDNELLLTSDFVLLKIDKKKLELKDISFIQKETQKFSLSDEGSYPQARGRSIVNNAKTFSNFVRMTKKDDHSFIIQHYVLSLKNLIDVELYFELAEVKDGIVDQRKFFGDTKLLNVSRFPVPVSDKECAYIELVRDAWKNKNKITVYPGF